MPHAFGTLDEMGSGPGFAKVRQALGVEAFGVNALILAPGQEGFMHYHDTQDELYFVHAGTARFEADGETRDLGPGGFLHAPAATHRKVSNAGVTELVVLIVGGKDGYVGRDGQLVDPADLERRRSFGSANS